MTKFPEFIFIDDASLSRRIRDNVIRSQMEVGPDKTRPIQSIPLVEISMTVSYSTKRVSEFRSWFSSIGHGAYWFLLKDPFDGSLKKFRFANTDIDWKKSGSLMRADVVLEGYDV